MKKLTLNEEKRKTIAGVFQDHWEATTNPKRQAHIEAIKNYDKMRDSIKPLISKIVREKYPQEDIDTIRRMTMKYGENVGKAVGADSRARTARHGRSARTVA